jgi:hypothetical protein
MNKTYDKAIELLHAASTPSGFVAAVQEEDNYRRIWTRDSALCGLAALSTDDAALKQTFVLSAIMLAMEAPWAASIIMPGSSSVPAPMHTCKTNPVGCNSLKPA